MTKKMVVTSEITPEKYKTYSKFPLDVCYIKTEIVTIVVAFHKDELCYSSFVEQNNPRRTIAHIKEIFPNSEISFTLTETDPFHSKDVIKILLKGSEFCMTVWKSLLNLKYGETCSYSDIGKTIGKPTAVRSVGNAIGKNPVAYFIPCHRVVKKNGRIGGFSAVGGILLKEILLQYERDHK